MASADRELYSLIIIDSAFKVEFKSDFFDRIIWKKKK
jgi:hypothetical protein